MLLYARGSMFFPFVASCNFQTWHNCADTNGARSSHSSIALIRSSPPPPLPASPPRHRPSRRRRNPRPPVLPSPSIRRNRGRDVRRPDLHRPEALRPRAPRRRPPLRPRRREPRPPGPPGGVQEVSSGPAPISSLRIVAASPLPCRTGLRVLPNLNF
jgi:hypothetical protein